MLLVWWQEGHPVVGSWRGYLSGTSCRLVYSQADATATHCLQCVAFFECVVVVTVYWFSKIQTGFTFLVPAHICSHGKRAAKYVHAFVMLMCTRPFI